MQTETESFFKKNSFVIMRNLFTQEELSIISGYCITAAKKAEYLSSIKSSHFRVDVGHFDDPQAPGMYSVYGDVLTDSLLPKLKNILEQNIGLSLNEQYSYWRIYRKGSVLKKHKDRNSCEISITACFDQKGNENCWPFFLKKDNEKKTHRIDLIPGDILIYRGCDVEHWREECMMDYVIQCFFHFTDKNGPFGKKKYDGRPLLGLPILQ